METNAHQNPSQEPRKKVRGNSFSLNQVSCNTIENFTLQQDSVFS